MFSCKPRNFKAFTLIELLTVISIIGVLSTVSIVSYNTVRMKERDSRRVVDINKLSVAFENYRSLYGTYPVCDQGCDYGLQGSETSSSDQDQSVLDSPWYTCLGEKLKPFIGNIPVDPGHIPGRGYCYNVANGDKGNKISISFFLESINEVGSVGNAVLDSDHSSGTYFNTIKYKNLVW